MASYTPNINLKKPTTSEMYNVLDWNDNSDKIDTAIGNLNSQIGNIDWSARGTQIPNNSDINDFKTPGKYFSSSTSATSTMNNAPITGGFSMFVVILGYDWINQYAMPVNGQTIKHRVYTASSNTWSAWQTLTFA